MNQPKNPKLERNERGQTVCKATSKVRFRSQATAERMMAHVIVHGGARQLPRRAYECPECGGWHLTSQERRP